jgi:Lon protease-like protein
MNTVLLPGLVLPIHVFEPRYRVLIQALMALPPGATRQFGVLANRTRFEPTQHPAGQHYLVGCTAQLREVTPYSDGRFDIVTVGEHRFRVVDTPTPGPASYPTAAVEFMVETGGAPDLDELAGAVGRQFAVYRQMIGVDLADPPEDPKVLSYLIAAAMVLDVPQRQRLLEIQHTADRLRAELELLRSEINLITAFGALPGTDLGRHLPNLN